MKNLPHEFQALAFISVNTSLEVAKKVIVSIEPVLSPVLTIFQIAIAAVTVLWIWRRARGAKLENQKAEKELESK